MYSLCTVYVHDYYLLSAEAIVRSAAVAGAVRVDMAKKGASKLVPECLVPALLYFVSAPSVHSAAWLRLQASGNHLGATFLGQDMSLLLGQLASLIFICILILANLPYSTLYLYTSLL